MAPTRHATVSFARRRRKEVYAAQMQAAAAAEDRRDAGPVKGCAAPKAATPAPAPATARSGSGLHANASLKTSSSPSPSPSLSVPSFSVPFFAASPHFSSVPSLTAATSPETAAEWCGDGEARAAVAVASLPCAGLKNRRSGDGGDGADGALPHKAVLDTVGTVFTSISSPNRR